MQSPCSPSKRVSDFLGAARARGPLDDGARHSLADEAAALASAVDLSGQPEQGVVLHTFAANLLTDLPGGRNAEELQRILGHLDQAAALAAPLGNPGIAGMLVRMRASAWTRAAGHLGDGQLDDAIRACLDALALPDVAAKADLAGPLSFNAGRFLIRRDGRPADAAALEPVVQLFARAYHAYRLLGMPAAAADAARYLVQLGAWHVQDGEGKPAAQAPGPAGAMDGPGPSAATLRPTPQFERLLGSSWVLLSQEPVEMCPSDDLPPFPAQMISVNTVPPGLDMEQALAPLRDMLLPLMWSGSIQATDVGRHGTCASLEVTGNPLTGDTLFVARPFALPGVTVLLIYETTDPRMLGRRDAVVEAIEGLTWPLLGLSRDAEAAGGAAPGGALPHLTAALAGSPIEAEFARALCEPDLGRRQAMLADVAGALFRSPGRVDALQAPAHRELVRMLEGISSSLARTGIEPLQMHVASLLARGLLLHPDAPRGAIERALRLSELLIARTREREPARWEEAMLSHLLGRAAWAVRTASEDYGDLGAIADTLTRNQRAAKRILTRLVDDTSFVRAQALDEFSPMRLARCDIALALMQRMLPADPVNALSPEEDGGDGGTPPEFSGPAPEPPGDTRPVSFFDTYALTLQAARREMSRFYAVDLERNREAMMAYLEGIRSEGTPRPSLLFLRGFRSARRIWIENTATARSRYVIPYLEEPVRLSLEAALVKCLGNFSAIALGGLQDPMGMARLGAAFDDETWRVGFEVVSQQTDLILVLPDDTDALTWELNRLVDQSRLDKTLLMMTPRALDAKAGRVWCHTVGTFARRGIRLPAFDEAGAFLLLGADGAPVERFAFEALTDGRLADRLEERLGVQARVG
jgi:hypothetical protein